MSKVLWVSDEVYEAIDKIKAAEGHQTVDSVLRTLLHSTKRYNKFIDHKEKTKGE